MTSRIVLAFSFLWVVAQAVPALAGSSTGDSSAIVAIVGGHSLTRADLDTRESAELMQAQYKYYLAERQAVEKLIDDEVVADQARKENISVDELMRRKVDSQLKTPSDADLRAVYEVMQTDQPYEKVSEDLKKQIMDRRRDKARKAYVEALRKQDNAQVMLDSPSVQVASIGAPSIGPANAPVKVVEFADYQCPYCKQVHPDLQKLREEFPQQMVLVYEDFPLPMHPFAEKAAEASHCADDQGKFWEYHDGLFAHSGPLDADALKGVARSLNLDQAKFTQCLDSGKEAPTVAKGLAEGKKLGLTGTPTFFINGHMVAGATKYDVLKEMVTHQLPPTSNDQRSGG